MSKRKNRIECPIEDYVKACYAHVRIEVDPIEQVIDDNNIKRFTELLRDPPAMAYVHDNDPLLHIVAQSARNKMLSILLDAGADVNQRGKRNRTPLHYALHEAHASTARFLIRHGADLEAQDAYGLTPMMTAALGFIDKRKALVRMLRRAGATYDLHSAICVQDLPHVKKVLAVEPEAIRSLPRKDRLLSDLVSIIACSSEPPFFVQTERGWEPAPDMRWRVVEENRWLLDSILEVIDINAYSRDSYPAIRVAMWGLPACPELVEYLASHGADVNVDTNGGGTALRWVRDGGDKKVEQVLLRYGAHE